MDYPVTITITIIVSTLIFISIFVLSARAQFILLWAYLPFVDMLKRMVFFDANASSLNMYVVMATQDLLILAIMGKLILSIASKPLHLQIKPVDIALALFAGYSLLSAMISTGVPFTARIAAIGMQVWPIATYFIAGALIKDSKSLRRIINLTIILGFIVALYGLRQFFFGVFNFEELWYQHATNSINVDTLRYNTSVGIFRTFGTLDSHSSYGLFLGISLVLLWTWRRKIRLLPTLLLSLLLISGLILSFTRFTWLNPILAFGFIILFKYDRIRPLFYLPNLRKASLILLVITLSFGLFYVAMNSLYGVSLVSASSNSYLRRALGTGTFEARLKASNLLEGDTKASFLGKGLASTGYFARKFDFSVTDINYHNIYVDTVDKMGFVGLVVFLIFLYFLIKTAIIQINLQTDPKTRELLIFLFGIFLALMTVSHFNGAVFYFGRAIPVYFWSICGILAHFKLPEEAVPIEKPLVARQDEIMI